MGKFLALGLLVYSSSSFAQLVDSGREPAVCTAVSEVQFVTMVQVAIFLAVLRVLLGSFYPWLFSNFWQYSVGPWLLQKAHGRGFAQNKDIGRPSYMPLSERDSYVVRLVAPSFDDLWMGLRDGALLGLAFVLFPDALALSIGFGVAVIVARFCFSVYKCRAVASKITDEVYFFLRNLLLFGAAIFSVKLIGL